MAGERIMIVDRDLDSLDFVTLTLAYAGYQPILCETSSEVGPLVHQEQPNLVILDIYIEHETAGLDVFAALREDTTTAHLPVLFCASDDALLRKVQAICTGRCEALRKPFRANDLLQKVAALVG